MNAARCPCLSHACMVARAVATDLTPMARIKGWLGYGVPFDRHDWHIDRGDGRLVRYVIDYWYRSICITIHAHVCIVHAPSFLDALNAHCSTRRYDSAKAEEDAPPALG